MTQLDAPAQTGRRLSALDEEERYGCFDVDGPFGADDPTEWRMISVLERTS